MGLAKDEALSTLDHDLFVQSVEWAQAFIKLVVDKHQIGTRGLNGIALKWVQSACRPGLLQTRS